MKVYDWKKKKIEKFKIDEVYKVKINYCVPSIDKKIGIEYARSAVFADCVRRFFEANQKEVLFIQEINDVDETVLNFSTQTGQSEKEIVSRYVFEFNNEMKKLNVKIPSIQLKTSERMEEIIEVIKNLLESQKAYKENGNVYYQPIAGDENTKITLWKNKGKEERYWDSIFGKGRPGVYIDSELTRINYTGETFDIRGEKFDFFIPEETDFTNEENFKKDKKVHWLYPESVQLDETNIDALIKQYGSNVLRWFFLSEYYNEEIIDGEQKIKEAEEKWEEVISFLNEMDEVIASGVKRKVLNPFYILKENDLKTNVENAMYESFDTKSVFESIGTHIKEIRVLKEQKRMDCEEALKMKKVLLDVLNNIGFDIEGKVS